MFVTLPNGPTYRINLHYDNINVYNNSIDNLRLAIHYCINGIVRIQLRDTFDEACAAIGELITAGSVDRDSPIVVYVETHAEEHDALCGEPLLSCYVEGKEV